MRLRTRLTLLACLLPTALAAQTPAVAPTLAVPPIQYQQRTLPNGLQVLSVEDHSSPTVTVQMWYHVGSKDDPQNRSGFAHLFEHIMFKSTKNMKPEQMDRMTEDVGGYNNASTGSDITNYYEMVPSNHLQRLLWAEAERLSNLKVDDANFKSERAVVQEEYRQSVLANPYGKLYNALDPASYKVHPYKRPTIGNIEELQAATLADVVAFHDTFYRPDNVTLIVAGDFNQKQLDGWVNEYFSGIAKPKAAIPKVTAVEPARTADARETLTSETAPLPAVAMTWLIPPAADADIVPLQVAAALLSQGESSRLNQSLVYRSQIAQSADAQVDARVDTGLFVLTAVMASGHQTAEAEKMLLGEVRKLADDPIPAAELDKVKTQLLTSELVKRQTAEGKAFALGSAVLQEGDAARANSDLAALQAVTNADVQRVLKRYVLDAHRVTIDYQPAKAAGKGATP
ncbi:MAG: insulinase family protein [Proteobacteria bacterium]|nr:insulinase family protein [Pseudomonadota bacterium]